MGFAHLLPPPTVRLALAGVLLLSSLAQALPGATTDAKGIAEQLPQSCAGAVTAQMPPEQLFPLLGPEPIEQMARSSGLNVQQLSQAADGRAFLALYGGRLVMALGLKTPLQPTGKGARVSDGWLIVSDSATLAHFLGESSSLKDAIRFTRVADHWPGGAVLFYSGELLKPSSQFLYSVSEYRAQRAQVAQALNFAPACPQVCAGMNGSQLEAWVAPLAHDIPAGQTWSSTLQGDKVHRQQVPGLYQQLMNLAQTAGTLEQTSLSLPLEWELYIGVNDSLMKAQKSGYSLAMALAAMLTGQPLSPTPFQETLQSQGDGLWVYRLDPTQTAQLADIARQQLPTLW
jgi:hypothetical protein